MHYLVQTKLPFNSREGIAQMANWLKQKYKIIFLFNTTVINVEAEKIITTNEIIYTSKIIIATGAEFENLFLETYINSGIVKCKLQMLKALTDAVIEPALFSSTSFVHYKAFKNCPSLKKVIERINVEQKEYITYGINLLVAQNNFNELIIGDSHEYGNFINPFSNEKIDELILAGIKNFLPTCKLNVIQRWYGVYCKHPTKKYFMAQPQQNTLIINALAGAGMTLSYGITKKVMEEFLD